jgi:hypothetical protein
MKGQERTKIQRLGICVTFSEEIVSDKNASLDVLDADMF